MRDATGKRVKLNSAASELSPTNSEMENILTPKSPIDPELSANESELGEFISKRRSIEVEQDTSAVSPTNAEMEKILLKDFDSKLDAKEKRAKKRKERVANRTPEEKKKINDDRTKKRAGHSSARKIEELAKERKRYAIRKEKELKEAA
jgi:hypothetical protein